MIRRACLGLPGQPCGALIPGHQRRCPTHQRGYEARRVARVRQPGQHLYGRAHRKAAGEAIANEGWCHWPGCFATGDLTGAHLVAGDPDAGYTVLCRKHNSIEANQRRRR